MFNVLAKPVDQAFVVDPDKVEEFLKEKADPKVKERILRNAEKLRLQRQCFEDERNKIR
jgi:hypothetical protein